jgi:hypothetical protein
VATPALFLPEIMEYDILATVVDGSGHHHRNFLCSAAKLPSMSRKHKLVPFFGQVRSLVMVWEKMAA